MRERKGGGKKRERKGERDIKDEKQMAAHYSQGLGTEQCNMIV